MFLARPGLGTVTDPRARKVGRFRNRIEPRTEPFTEWISWARRTAARAPGRVRCRLYSPPCRARLQPSRVQGDDFRPFFFFPFNFLALSFLALSFLAFRVLRSKGGPPRFLVSIAGLPLRIRGPELGAAAL